MMSGSGGLKPRAVAGRPSVTRLTQRSWTGMRASGRPRAAVRKILGRKRREAVHTVVERVMSIRTCAAAKGELLLTLQTVKWVVQ